LWSALVPDRPDLPSKAGSNKAECKLAESNKAAMASSGRSLPKESALTGMSPRAERHFPPAERSFPNVGQLFLNAEETFPSAE
jgi:hypothetical protein